MKYDLKCILTCEKMLVLTDTMLRCRVDITLFTCSSFCWPSIVLLLSERSCISYRAWVWVVLIRNCYCYATVFFVKSSSPMGGLLDRLFENLIDAAYRHISDANVITISYLSCQDQTLFYLSFDGLSSLLIIDISWFFCQFLKSLIIGKLLYRFSKKWRKNIVGSAGIWTRDHLHPKQVSYP